MRFGLFQLGVAYAIVIMGGLSSYTSCVTAADASSVVLRGAAANNTNTVIHHHRVLQEDVDVVGLFLIKVIDYGPEDDSNPIPFVAESNSIEADGSNRHRRKLPGKSGSRGRPERTYHVEYSDGTIHEIKNTGPPEWVADLVSGRDVIEMKGANINQDGSINAKGKPPTKVTNKQGKKNGVRPFGQNRLLRRTPEQERNLSELHRQLQSGARTVLAVRIVANDGAYSSTAADLQNYIYRPSTSGSSFFNNGAFPSKYAECSYNKLTFDPMVDTTMVSNPNDGTTTSIVNGVVTIKANIDVASGNTNFENEVTNKLNAVFGVSYPSSPVAFFHPTELADHIMYCLPPGVMSGAYAYLGHWLSVYNDNSCNELSTTMHEIGHNLAFYHSGETGGGGEYGDQVGLMGVSYGGSQPNMCFNSAKSWQAGWYSDKTAVVNTGECFEDDIYGIASYDDPNVNNVIIKIEDGVTDYFVTFNYRAGINSGTQEAANQVTVTKTSGLPSNPSESDLVAKLSSGGSYTIASSNIQVSVQSINGDHAVVRISQNGDPCGATSAPTPCPVSGICGDGICDACLSESFFSCNTDCLGLSTNFDGGYSSFEANNITYPLVGNMFKVLAIGKDITVKGFIIHTATSGSGTVRIYEKSGGYASDRYNSAAWNLIMQTSVNGQGPGQPTQLPNLDTPLLVSAGTNKSFLVWCSLGTDSSFEGFDLGDTFKQNDDMSIDKGYAVQDEFTGIYVSPLVFNGVVEYDLVDLGTSNPSLPPSQAPTKAPTPNPTTNPSQSPSVSPSRSPSQSPETSEPTKAPSKSPVTDMPSRSPSQSPSRSPSKEPSASPSRSPSQSPETSEPTKAPSKLPVTDMPSRSPSQSPSRSPSKEPSSTPSKSPSVSPSKIPTGSPSEMPTPSPSLNPSRAPSKAPTTDSPSSSPVTTPTTESPSANPTPSPSQSPSNKPSRSPSVKPSRSPSKSPSKEPTKAPSDMPTANPTLSPSASPSIQPSDPPTPSPSKAPSQAPTLFPTTSPTNAPVGEGSCSDGSGSCSANDISNCSCNSRRNLSFLTALKHPKEDDYGSRMLQRCKEEGAKCGRGCCPGLFCNSSGRCAAPAAPTTPEPTNSPTTKSPTLSPVTTKPTGSPSDKPSPSPSLSPSRAPSKAPTTDSPSSSPVTTPTTESPTANPTPNPSQSPSKNPSQSPSSQPTTLETCFCILPSPTGSPTEPDIGTPAPSYAPTPVPTANPSQSPSKASPNPTLAPSDSPTKAPTPVPTSNPSKAPSESPSPAPSPAPTSSPVTDNPTDQITTNPTPPPAPQCATSQQPIPNGGTCPGSGSISADLCCSGACYKNGRWKDNCN